MTGPLKQLFCSTALLPSVYITCNHRHGQAPILESPGVSFCMNACESKGAILSAGLLTRATEVCVLGSWKGNKEGFFSLVLKKIHPSANISCSVKDFWQTCIFYQKKQVKYQSSTRNIHMWHEKILACSNKYFCTTAKHFTRGPLILKQICTWRSWDETKQ